MRYRTSDVVVLNTDIPQRDLRRGDLGTVVEIQSPAALEVEFVTATGRTWGLVKLAPADVRPVADNDIVAVRPLPRSA